LTAPFTLASSGRGKVMAIFAAVILSSYPTIP
jgi:hypothetical protein